MPAISLSFLNRRTISQRVRRVCHEIATVSLSVLNREAIEKEVRRVSHDLAAISLSVLNREAIDKEVCRVCHEFAELKTGRLCADCTRIGAQIRSRFDGAVRGTIAIPAEKQCKRPGCLCAACDGKTVDPHPLYLFDLARADTREIHFHPRCHELWLEAVNELTTNPEHISDIGKA